MLNNTVNENIPRYFISGYHVARHKKGTVNELNKTPPL